MSRVQVPSLTPFARADALVVRPVLSCFFMLEDHVNGSGSKARRKTRENDRAGRGSARRGAESLCVHGALFSNSAAKFWSSLLDELCLDFEDCDAIILDTLTDARLARNLLFPQAALQSALDSQPPLSDIRRAMREAAAEFGLTGPPDAVRARMLCRGEERESCSLPLDCVDADVFPLLLVWLLEWSEIPECEWNNKRLQGRFDASDRRRDLIYHFQFSLINRHVSEGLFRMILTIHYGRSCGS